MRRPISLVVSGAAAACLVFLGSAATAHAEPEAGLFDRVATAWMGVVGVIGADDLADEEAGMAEPEDSERTFAIDDEAEGEDEAEDREPDRDHAQAAGGRRHHRGGHAHGGPHHRGPRHPGMGPGPKGPPGGPDPHHAALRAFREISRRLARIEEKLGVENGPPSGPMGERPWGPPPEMRHRHHGPEAAPGRPRPDVPEEIRERMQEGRRRMEAVKERMEEARRKFQAMEERIKQLEAEVERLKAAK